jgi:hypothetical protein
MMRCDSSACVSPTDEVGRVVHASAAGSKHDVAAATHCATDTDGDGVCDAVDNCPLVANAAQADRDDDGIGDACDNCLTLKNSCQADGDHDGTGDVCEFLAVDPVVGPRILLGPPAPNPSRGTIAFDVHLPRAAFVRLSIYDVRGRLVGNVASREFDAGLHHLQWRGKLHSGAFILRLEAGGETHTRKFSLVQ